MEYTDINFNLNELRDSFLKLLQTRIDPNFKVEDSLAKQGELWFFSLKRGLRIVSILAFENGRIDLTLERTGIESFYRAKPTDSNADEAELSWTSMTELSAFEEDMGVFARTGKVNTEHFELIQGDHDDWPKDSK